MSRSFGATVLLATLCSAACSAPSGRLVLVGIDGAEWDVINRMIDGGELPNFARLKNEGAHGPLINPGPQVSPVVWTTFATGHFSRRHGVLDFVFPYKPGAKRPVDATLRQEPAIWNLVSHYGGVVGVVGYFVSHPAEQVNGFVASELAPARAQDSVWPPDLLDSPTKGFARLREWDNDWSLKKKIWERFFPWDYSPQDAANPDSPYHEVSRLVEDRVDLRLLSDEFLRLVTMAVAEKDTDLLITYFRIVDVVSHSLWFYHDSSDFDEQPDTMGQKLLGQMVAESYRYVDEVIGDLRKARPRDNFLVLSDHGFGSATGTYAPKKADWLLTGNHRPDGVFLAAGPDIRSGIYNGITILDVMPMLCALLKLPVSREMPGQIREGIFREGYLLEHPVEQVPSYEFDWRPKSNTEPQVQVQLETIKSLRALGYIGDVPLDPHARDSTYDFWHTEPKLLGSNLHGEVVYYLLRNDPAKAESIINLATKRAPEILPQLMARVRAKIQALREELHDPTLADSLEPFLKRFPGPSQARTRDLEAAGKD